MPPAWAYGLSASSAVLWGFMPVLSRFIQTREPGSPSTPALLFCLCSVDAVLLGGFMAAQELRRRARRGGDADKADDGDPLRRQLRFALMYGLMCTVRMLTNLQSTRWTTAFNTQATAMMMPFVTAFLARIFLAERIPRALPPTLIATVIGSLLVLVGSGSGGRGGLTWLDAAGVGVQLISVLLSAVIKLVHVQTKGILSKGQLMLAQFVVTAAPLGVWSFAWDMPSLRAIANMDAAGWGCFFGLALGVYGVANMSQIVATRLLGASTHSASNSLRLVSACFGSAIVLHEVVDQPLEWLGIVLIIASLTFFYWATSSRARAGPRQPAEEGAVMLDNWDKAIPASDDGPRPDPERGSTSRDQA